MKKFVCTVCGYIHEGDTPPERCPVCKTPYNLIDYRESTQRKIFERKEKLNGRKISN